jgi:hypothetical protein
LRAAIEHVYDPGMELGSMHEFERDLRACCEGLDPDAVPLADVLPAFRCLERIAKLVEGAKLRLLRKLDDVGVGQLSGCRDTAEFVARTTGSTVGAARDALATSARLPQQHATDLALASGRISGEQARAVSGAVAADPSAERSLLRAAPGRTLRDLRRRCTEVRANAHTDDRARWEAIRRARSCRTWTDAEGAWNLQVRHLPEVGAEIEALLAPFAHARFEAGRRSGEWEPREAYAADGLLDLARAAGSGRSAAPTGARRADTKVFVHIDLATLQSGERRPGTTCHIDGVGPVDVAHVRSLLGEAFVVALVENGQDVRRVIHLGRQVTAHQRSALEARGYRCEVPGCEVSWGLEIDHTTEWARSRTTTLDQLAWLCRHHHRQRTHQGARLAGDVGQRTWIPPAGRPAADPAHGPPGSRAAPQRAGAMPSEPRAGPGSEPAALFAEPVLT